MKNETLNITTVDIFGKLENETILQLTNKELEKMVSKIEINSLYPVNTFWYFNGAKVIIHK